jgi:type I restriction enzyme M protein
LNFDEPIINYPYFKIPLPPLEIQKQIVAEIEVLEKEIEELKKENKNIPEKKKEILNKYL